MKQTSYENFKEIDIRAESFPGAIKPAYNWRRLNVMYLLTQEFCSNSIDKNELIV